MSRHLVPAFLALAPGAQAVLATGLLAPLATSQRTRLSPPLERLAVGQVLAVRVSADGAFAVFAADPIGADAVGLHRRSEQRGLSQGPIAGGRFPRDVSGRIVPGSAVVDFEIAADGSRVVYRGNVDDPGALELFMSLLDPPARPAPTPDRSVPR